MNLPESASGPQTAVPRGRGLLLRASLLIAGFALVALSSALLLVGGWDDAPAPSAAAFEARPIGERQAGEDVTPTAASEALEGASGASGDPLQLDALIPTPPIDPTATDTAQASTPQPAAPPVRLSPVAPEAAPATPTPQPPPPAPSCPQAAISGYALTLFNAINAERVSYGMAGLAADGCSAYVAQIRSDDMASRGYFSHTNPEGQTTFSLLDAYGVPHGWSGENLARNNYPDSESVGVAIRDLMLSEGHRANILSGNYTRMGVAVAFDGAGMKYFTMVFIGPP